MSFDAALWGIAYGDFVLTTFDSVTKNVQDRCTEWIKLFVGGVGGNGSESMWGKWEWV